jgi:hypothetical protein
VALQNAVEPGQETTGDIDQRIHRIFLLGLVAIFGRAASIMARRNAGTTDAIGVMWRSRLIIVGTFLD